VKLKFFIEIFKDVPPLSNCDLKLGWTAIFANGFHLAGLNDTNGKRAEMILK